VDAIVVPTYRPPEFIQAAAALARELNCPLLALCSDRARSREVAERMSPAAGFAVEVSSVREKDWPRLATVSWQPGRPETYLDRARKRNAGLMVARMMGWSTVLFLDDDVTDLRADHFRAAAGHLGRSGMRLIAWRARRFPDNSVASHALRACGGRQEVFIGAGTYLVDCEGRLPYFPATFNEDWLFFHGFLRTGQVGFAGEVKQDRFNPFDPLRASQEEFGDVMGEALFGLIHQGRSLAAACLPPFWAEVIEERREMHAFTEKRLWERRDRATTWDGWDVAQVMRCVMASREALDGIRPEDLAEFTSAWRHDLYRWNAVLPRLPRFTRITDALSWIGLREFHESGG
jgi:hypothetical protein